MSDPDRLRRIQEAAESRSEVASLWASKRAAAALAIALVMGFVAIGVVQWQRPAVTRGARAGAPAPAFDLPGLDGGTVRLQEYRGRPVVLHFWASWCAPCRAEAPALGRVATSVRDQVVFLGINVRDDEEKARTFLDGFGIPYPNARDVGGEAEALYTGGVIPTTVFIAADGTVRQIWVGRLDEAKLMELVDTIRDASPASAAWPGDA